MQRLAIARSLINKPIKRLNKELNQTIIMVTHEAEDKKYVDRVIWKDGLILEK